MLPLEDSHAGRDESGLTIDAAYLRSKGLLQALVVDDEDAYAANVSRELAAYGFGVDVASSLPQARELLGKRKYALCLMDNIFEDTQRPRGSEFLLKETALLRGAAAVLLTGYAIEHIVERQVLAERGIKVIPKAPGHMAEVRALAAHVAEEYIANYSHELEKLIDDLLRGAESAEALSVFRLSLRMAGRGMIQLRGNLEALPDQETPQFFIGGRTLSPREVLGELAAGTDLAADLVDMVLDDILEDGDEGT